MPYRNKDRTLSNLQLVTNHSDQSEQMDNLLKLQLICSSQSVKIVHNDKLIQRLENKTNEFKLQTIEYKSKANYWEKQFSQLKSKEHELKGEIEELKAQLKKREQQLFGRKSEKRTIKVSKIIKT